MACDEFFFCPFDNLIFSFFFEFLSILTGLMISYALFILQVYGLEKLHDALLHRPRNKPLLTVSLSRY